MMMDERNDKNDKSSKKNIKNTSNISDINAKEKEQKNAKPKFWNNKNRNKRWNNSQNPKEANSGQVSQPSQPVQSTQNNPADSAVRKQTTNHNNHNRNGQQNKVNNITRTNESTQNISKPSRQNQNTQNIQNNQNNQHSNLNPYKNKLPPMIKVNDKNKKNRENRNSRENVNNNKFTKENKNVNNSNNSNNSNRNSWKPRADSETYSTAAINKFDDSNNNNAENFFDMYPEEEIIVKPPVETEEDIGEKVEIVGVRFKSVGKIYFFYPDNIIYSLNDKVIVETSRGMEMGYVILPNRNVSTKKVVQPLKHVVRRATEEDIKRSEKNKRMAKEAVKIATERIKFHNLKMKLIEAEYTFDNSKLLYYFTADGRVDFRDLVKDLASIFKIRIELRQIGIRDQTKILGGLSICGRPFCCNSFLQDFAQVTIKMAKEQNISINSAKISGACGRLMCCLKYEHETYEYLYKDTPRVGAIVETSVGETGVVIESNVLTGMCKIKVNQNQKNHGDSDNVVKPYFKRQLKVIGFMKNEHEHMYGGEREDDINNANLEDLGIIEDGHESENSGADIVL